jgi:uncharacterized membrane protein
VGAGHGRHSHGDDPRVVRRLVTWVILPIAVVTLVGMVWLWPQQGIEASDQAPLPQLEGTVAEVHQEACPAPMADEVNGCGTATVLLSGSERADGAEQVVVDLPNGPGAPRVAPGDDVVLIESATPDGVMHAIVDRQRSTPLLVLTLAFVLAVVAFGRWRGVTALAGLGVTFGVLLLFVVPAILAGEPPLLVAIVGSATIMLTVLYLTHGVTASTTVAVLGTLASLTLTGLISALTVSGLALTGITDDLATSVVTTYGVNMEGLLLAGIVIGALGVLDDVTVTQAATVDELAKADPSLGAGALYRAGARVGRAHIASVINTIILAYAGSSLPLLILILAGGSSPGDVVATQVVAQEIARSAVATIGLVAAVPLTTALAAVVARGRAVRGEVAPAPRPG